MLEAAKVASSRDEEEEGWQDCDRTVIWVNLGVERKDCSSLHLLNRSQLVLQSHRAQTEVIKIFTVQIDWSDVSGEIQKSSAGFSRKQHVKKFYGVFCNLQLFSHLIVFPSLLCQILCFSVFAALTRLFSYDNRKFITAQLSWFDIKVYSFSNMM